MQRELSIYNINNEQPPQKIIERETRSFHRYYAFRFRKGGWDKLSLSTRCFLWENKLWFTRK